MEAVKKLPMISFELKCSPDATSFYSLKRVNIFFVFHFFFLIIFFVN